MPTIADVMRPEFIEVAPEDTLGEVADRMNELNMGAVAVKDFGRLIGILTERDVLHAIGDGGDPDTELVAAHQTTAIISAAPDWSLEEAASAMLRGGFRRLIVFDRGEVVGLISMRDIVRCWTEAGVVR